MSAPSPASTPPASSGPSSATFTASRTELRDVFKTQMTFLDEMSSTLDRILECLPRCPVHGFNIPGIGGVRSCRCQEQLSIRSARLKCQTAIMMCARRKLEFVDYIKVLSAREQETSGASTGKDKAEAREGQEKSQETAATEQGAKRKRDEEAEAPSKKPATSIPSRPPRAFIAALDTSTSEATALWNALPAARHAPALNYIAYAEEHRLRWPYFPASGTHVSTWIASEAEDRAHIVKHGGNLSEVLTEMLDGLESWHVELGFGSVVTQRARAVVAGAAAWWG